MQFVCVFVFVFVFVFLFLDTLNLYFILNGYVFPYHAVCASYNPGGAFYSTGALDLWKWGRLCSRAAG